MPIKAITDILMLILFLLLMADTHTGNVAHEWLGIAMAGAFLLHTWLNRNWYKTLTKGRYNFSRIARLVLNMLLLLALMGTLISAIPISRTVFSFLGLRGELFFRTLHVFCANWCFILAAVHLGVYNKRINAVLKRHIHIVRPMFWSRISPVLYVMLAAYAVYVFQSRELFYSLTMNSSFMMWNENEYMMLFIFDYITLFLLCVWTTCFLSSLFRVEGRNTLHYGKAAMSRIYVRYE